MKQPSDSSARARAVDPQCSFLVQAPAGSGKTELLTDRILALLATAQRPEEIVAITFTRKAAAEMHARVLEKLAAATQPKPVELYRVRSWELAGAAMRRDQEMGWDLLEFPARLSIRTIDALCAHLVHAMPWITGLGGMPAIATDPFRHYEAAAQDCLLLVESEPAVARFLEHMDVNINLATEVLASMLDSRDQWQPILADSEDISVLQHNLERLVVKQLRRVHEAMPLAWFEQIGDLLVFAANTQGQDSPSWLLADCDRDSFSLSMQGLRYWQALAGMLLTTDGSLRKRVDVRQGFPAKTVQKERMSEWLKANAEDQSWVAQLALVRTLPHSYSDEQADILANLIQVLWLASAQLKLQFAQQSEVDFTEIAQRALQALGHADEPGELLLALDRSVRHLLVDEFQDTSHSQMQLLEKLTSGWESGDGRTVFLVGDPMQSIYRFRKAEVGLFLRVEQEARLGAVQLEVLRLSNNFRSHPSLVDWVNTMGGHVFPAQPDPDLGVVSYAPSVAFNEGAEEPRVTFHPAWLHKDQEESHQQAALDHALQQSRQGILEQVSAALQRYPNSAHPVAILVRARGHLRGIVRLLREHHIPCRAVELESLGQRPVVADIVQLVKALSHPGDRLAYLSVLRSPLCGLRLSSLHRLCAGAPERAIRQLLVQANSSGWDPNEWRRLEHARQVLLDQSNRSGLVPFSAWVQDCWRRLGGELAYSQEADRADAERVFRLLEGLCPYGVPDQRELQAQLSKLFATPKNIGPAVEVMTIHKSKGLEFESVILYGLHHQGVADRDPLIRIEQTPDSLVLGPIAHRGMEGRDPVALFLAQREKQRAEHELRRLLYVAVTRARQELHLFGELVVKPGQKAVPPDLRSLLSRLWLSLPEQLAPAWQSFAAKDPAIPVFGQRQGTRLRRLSLSNLLDPVQQESTGLDAGQGWQWNEELNDDIAMGDVAHAWLERMGREGAEGWSPERVQENLGVIELQLRRAGVRSRNLPLALAHVQATLQATLRTERGRWLLGLTKAHREWSLLDGSGRVSIIDLAISQQDHWLVVDYKTSIPWEGESEHSFGQRMMARYGEQLLRYCAQVSGLDGRPAKAALYFPRVDLWLPYHP